MVNNRRIGFYIFFNLNHCCSEALALEVESLPLRGGVSVIWGGEDKARDSVYARNTAALFAPPSKTRSIFCIPITLVCVYGAKSADVIGAATLYGTHNGGRAWTISSTAVCSSPLSDKGEGREAPLPLPGSGSMSVPFPTWLVFELPSCVDASCL